MNLDEIKKQKVAAWIREGLKLADIQKRLASELGVNLTYMEVRFLVDDLKLTPKDQPPPQAPGEISGAPRATGVPPEAEESEAPFPDEAEAAPVPPAPGGGSLSLSVDQVARPGALVSGNVSFSDGNSAAWYLDQMGRLGIVPKQSGYRPSPQDLQTFQLELQKQLQKLGF